MEKSWFNRIVREECFTNPIRKAALLLPESVSDCLYFLHKMMTDRSSTDINRCFLFKGKEPAASLFKIIKAKYPEIAMNF